MPDYFATHITSCSKCGCSIFEKKELVIVKDNCRIESYKTVYKCQQCGQLYELILGKGAGFVEYKTIK